MDVDVASSLVANTVAGLVLPQVSGVVVSHAFVLEGQTEDELPERLLGCVRAQGVRMVESTVELE